MLIFEEKTFTLLALWYQAFKVTNEFLDSSSKSGQSVIKFSVK